MGQPLILPKWKFFDANGVVLSGGKLYSYAAGTTTPQATYTDTTEGTPNANPLILDASGEGVIWLGSLSYKFILKDSLDNVLWTADGIQTIPNGIVTTVKLADGSVTTAKIVDAAVTTAKILDNAVTNAKIVDGAITGAKIPDASIAVAKLSASTAIAFVDTSSPRSGDGPSAFPVKSWAAPTTLAAPASPPLGDGQSVAWSPNGKLLAVAENNTDFVAIYSRFGTELVKLSPGLSGAPSVAAKSVSWSPDGQYLHVIGGDSKLYAFQKFGNAYAQIAPPSTAITTANAIACSPNGNHLAAACDGTPYIINFKRSDVVKNHYVSRWNSTAAQSISNGLDTILKFATSVEDNGSGSAPAGFFQFACQRNNGYVVTAYVKMNGSGFATGTAIQLTLMKNGVAYCSLDYWTTVGTATPQNPSVKGSTWVPLTTTPGTPDSIQVQINQTAGSAQAVSGSAADVWVTVTEDPGFEQLSSFAILSSPVALPASNAKAVAWSPDGQFLAVGNTNTSYVFTVSSASASGGATYTNNGATFVVLSPISGGTTLSTTGNGLPLASGTLTRSSGAGTGDPTITFSSYAPPAYVTIYQRTGDTFAKCADPVALPAGQVNGLAWSPDGLTLTCVHAVTPFITSYYRSSITSTTFTKISANPGTLPASTGNACAYNSLGNKLAVAHDSSPFVTIYSVAGTGNSKTFTKDTNPVTLPTGNGKSVSWTPDGQYLSVGHVSSPYVTNYQTSGSFGSNAITYVSEVDLV